MNGKVSDTLLRNLKKIRGEHPTRVGEAIYAELQIELTEAKKRTPVWNPAVPVPAGQVPGALRASGYVGEPQYKGNRIWCEIGFGGPAVMYAIYVHENPDAFHAIGEWKFLESVLNESRSHMNARLAARLHFDRITL